MTPEFARVKLAALLQRPSARALLPDSFASPVADETAGLTLTHPLSHYAPYSLAPLPAPLTSLDEIFQAAASVLADLPGSDPVLRYLAAWRWLPDAIRAHEPDDRRLGALWDVLPADPRQPDTTVWDHASVTSAMAGTDGCPAFLVFALGPVQGFIAQSRSTRDLWIGSYLVSHLSWAAIRAIAEQLGPDALLYPSLHGQPLVDDWLEARGVPKPSAVAPVPAASRRVAAFPNKLLALIPEDRARELGDLVACAVRDAWSDLAQQARVWLAQEIGTAWQPEGWDDQIARHVETAWTALAWPKASEMTTWLERVRRLLGEGSLAGFEHTLAGLRRVGLAQDGVVSAYGPAHGLAQRAFDARKLTRQFGPAGEPGFKCVLCGERAPALGGTAGFGQQRAVWQHAAGCLGRPDLLDAGGDERLCAVCLTRRIAPETDAISNAVGAVRPGFPSTSTFATLTFRRSLLALLRSDEGAAILAPLERFFDALDVLHGHRAALGATVRIGPDVLPGDGWTLDPGSGKRRALADRACQFDGEWLLPETYPRRRAELERRGGAASVTAALDGAGIALRQLLSTTSRIGLHQPTAYYAILVLDGDRMGRWVSGDQHRVTLGEVLHPDARAMVAGHADWDSALGDRRLFGPTTHAALGAILRDFALWVVPDVVEREHGGRVVYAGGDDVLALLPAARALDAVEGLRARYTSAFLARDAMGDLHELPHAADPDLVIFRGMGPDATVSAGLLFVHHLLPLGLALDEACRLERQAKAGGRDAVAVGVARRSGPDDELVVVSRHRRGGTPVTSLVGDARALLGKQTDPGWRELGAASSRLPYLLREAAPILDQLEDPAARRRAIIAVANRHVGREDGRHRLLGLYDSLATPLPASSERAAQLVPPSRPVDELARLLRLARFLEAET